LKKSIANSDSNASTYEAGENSESSKMQIESNGQLPVEPSPEKEPDVIPQDSSSENEEDNLRVTPQNVKQDTPENPESGKSNAKKTQSSQPEYVVKVDISDQKVYVYRNGTQIRTMICSTGVKGHETPEGTFKIKGRGEWFFSKKFQQGGKYWVGFIGGTYLFHSVPTDHKQRIIEEEALKLGMPASHGCVRLSEDDARWFFNTIPDGSKVDIQK